MADNLTFTTTVATAPSGTVVATDELGDGSHVQKIKLIDGTANGTAGIPGDATNGLDVDVTRVSGTVTVGDGGSTISVDDGAGSLTVDGTVAISGTVAVTDNASTLSVDDGGGTLTVDVGTALPAGNNNIGDVDVASIAAGNNLIGQVKISDGTDVADVLDLANSNPITVAIVDGTGDQITSFGGGTQYTEGDTDATITGTAVMFESNTGTSALSVVSNTTPLPVSDAGTTLSIDDGAGSITVDGTVTVDNISTSVTPGTGAANLGKAEDAAHSSGDTGVMALAVRNDTASALAGTDGDYIPLTTNSLGALWVVAAGYTDIIAGTLTRPANTTAYTAEDEVATNSTSPLSLNLARYNQGSGYITGATLIYSNNPSTTPQFRLIVTDQTVTLAGDNAALALSDSDAAKSIGFIDFFATQAGASGTSGALILKGSLSEPIPFKAQSGTQAIFFTLVTKNGFTPIANSETIEVRIGVEQN